MARVIPEEVKEIVTTALSDFAIQTHIRAASMLVDTLQGTGLTDATLKMIELYISAHTIYEMDLNGTIANESIGDASKSYRANKESPYWAMAVRLSNGALLSGSLRQAVFLVHK